MQATISGIKPPNIIDLFEGWKTYIAVAVAIGYWAYCKYYGIPVTLADVLLFVATFVLTIRSALKSLQAQVVNAVVNPTSAAAVLTAAEAPPPDPPSTTTVLASLDSLTPSEKTALLSEVIRKLQAKP